MGSIISSMPQVRLLPEPLGLHSSSSGCWACRELQHVVTPEQGLCKLNDNAAITRGTAGEMPLMIALHCVSWHERDVITALHQLEPRAHIIMRTAAVAIEVAVVVNG